MARYGWRHQRCGARNCSGGHDHVLENNIACRGVTPPLQGAPSLLDCCRFKQSCRVAGASARLGYDELKAAVRSRNGVAKGNPMITRRSLVGAAARGVILAAGSPMASQTSLSEAEARATGLDLSARVREDFPILATTVHGRPLVYLDSAASAQKPRSVLDRIQHAYTQAAADRSDEDGSDHPHVQCARHPWFR
jgi:hypothetical protein